MYKSIHVYLYAYIYVYIVMYILKNLGKIRFQHKKITIVSGKLNHLINYRVKV